MRYLSGEEILAVHARIVDATGGRHGVLDMHLFKSLIEKAHTRLGGKGVYPGVFHKATIYLEGFATYHVFVDGNKRTAFAVAARFLYINGYKLSAKPHEIELFMIEVAMKKHRAPMIATWLERNSASLRKQKS